jgi:hypothetical protein
MIFYVHHRPICFKNLSEIIFYVFFKNFLRFMVFSFLLRFWQTLDNFSISTLPGVPSSFDLLAEGTGTQLMWVLSNYFAAWGIDFWCRAHLEEKILYALLFVNHRKKSSSIYPLLYWFTILFCVFLVKSCECYWWPACYEINIFAALSLSKKAKWTMTIP